MCAWLWRFSILGNRTDDHFHWPWRQGHVHFQMTVLVHDGG